MNDSQQISAVSGRCCAILRNRRTRKTRQCRHTATDGSFCERHAPAINAAREFGIAASQAEREYVNPEHREDDE